MPLYIPSIFLTTDILNFAPNNSKLNRKMLRKLHSVTWHLCSLKRFKPFYMTRKCQIIDSQKITDTFLLSVQKLFDHRAANVPRGSYREIASAAIQHRWKMDHNCKARVREERNGDCEGHGDIQSQDHGFIESQGKMMQFYYKKTLDCTWFLY